MSDVAITTKSPQQSLDAGNTMPEGQQVSNSLVRPTDALKAGGESPKQVQPNSPGALRRQMDCLFEICPVVDQAFLDVIHAASTAERQEILNSERFREAIRLNISGHLAMVVISALMEG